MEAPVPGRRKDDGIGPQVLHLEEDVLLGGDLEPFLPRQFRVVRRDHRHRPVPVPQPLTDVGGGGERIPILVERLDRPAVGVAADDDVPHLQVLHGVLHRRRHPRGIHEALRIRRDEVPDVPDDEEVPRLPVGDRRGIDPGVGAGDEQRLGELPVLRQPKVQLPVRAPVLLLETMDPRDQLPHGADSSPPGFSPDDTRFQYAVPGIFPFLTCINAGGMISA